MLPGLPRTRKRDVRFQPCLPRGFEFQRVDLTETSQAPWRQIAKLATAFASIQAKAWATRKACSHEDRAGRACKDRWLPYENRSDCEFSEPPEGSQQIQCDDRQLRAKLQKKGMGAGRLGGKRYLTISIIRAIQINKASPEVRILTLFIRVEQMPAHHCLRLLRRGRLRQ